MWWSPDGGPFGLKWLIIVHCVFLPCQCLCSCTFCIAAHSTSLPLWMGTWTDPRNRTRNLSIQPSFWAETRYKDKETFNNQISISYCHILLLQPFQYTLVHFFGHLDSIKGREYAGNSCPHIITMTPQVLRLVQYQHWVICLEAQLIWMAGDKSEDRHGKKWQILVLCLATFQICVMSCMLTCRRLCGSAVSPLHPKHRRTDQMTQHLNNTALMLHSDNSLHLVSYWKNKKPSDSI